MHGHLPGIGRLTSEIVCSSAGCTTVVFSNRAWLHSFVCTLRSLFIQCDACLIHSKPRCDTQFVLRKRVCFFSTWCRGVMIPAYGVIFTTAYGVMMAYCVVDLHA